jgi:hypothetical protein
MATFDSITKTYTESIKTDPVDRLTIEIGDSKQVEKFYPQVKMMRWDNEVNFSVRLVNDELAPILSDMTDILWSGSILDAKFYPTDGVEEGGYEFEVILKEPPKSNVISFTIQTKGLEVCYQPPLKNENPDGSTWQDNPFGGQSFRPANVTGSYALYHNGNPVNYEGGKLYRTGKAGHIYRPQIQDSVGTKVWGELKIDEKMGILTVTIPQDFLDKAVYPVFHAAGLTFGYSGTAATSDSAGSGNTIYFQLDALSPAGINTLTNLTVCCSGIVSTGWRYAFYSEAAGPIPQNRLARDASTFTAGTTKAYYPNTVNWSYGLAATTQYWGAVCNSANTFTWHWDTGGSKVGGWEGADTPDPATYSGAWSDVHAGMYATYTAAGGGATAVPEYYQNVILKKKRMSWLY